MYIFYPPAPVSSHMLQNIDTGQWSPPQIAAAVGLKNRSEDKSNF